MACCRREGHEEVERAPVSVKRFGAFLRAAAQSIERGAVLAAVASIEDRAETVVQLPQANN